MLSKSEAPGITSFGKILGENISSFLRSGEPAYRETALTTLRNVIIGYLVSIGYDRRIIRHLDISFSDWASPKTGNFLLNDVKHDLEEKFGKVVVERIALALRPLEETYPEDTLDDIHDIEGYWTGNGFFEIPKEAGRFTALVQADFEDVYDLKSMHNKGDISREELVLMREHNRKIYDFLVNLGWNPPDYISPNNLN